MQDLDLFPLLNLLPSPSLFIIFRGGCFRVFFFFLLGMVQRDLNPLTLVAGYGCPQRMLEMPPPYKLSLFFEVGCEITFLGILFSSF